MSEPKDPKESRVQVGIQIDDQTAQGVYANLALVNHTETEFILDFLFLQPQQPRGQVRSRIISSPKHTKRLLGALKENVRRYEERFGEINITGPDPAEGLLQ